MKVSQRSDQEGQFLLYISKIDIIFGNVALDVGYGNNRILKLRSYGK